MIQICFESHRHSTTHKKKSTFNLQIYESQIPQSYFPTKEVLQKHTVLADMKNTCIRKKKKKQKQPIFEPIYV